MPMQLVHSSVNMPSGVVSPKRIPRSFSNWRATTFAPFIMDDMSRLSRMMNLPLGRVFTK